MTLPTVTIILVTRNAEAFIGRALDSTQAQSYPADRVRIVVVDNASTDRTAAVVREDYSQVTLIAEDRNRGFAVGCNIGMQCYPADYFALVNPDVTLDPNWLTCMIETMEADPSIGVAGSKIFNGDGLLLQHTGATISDNALTSHRGANERDVGQYDSATDVDYVTGAALATRGKLAAELGYLPSAYFLYFEEVEYCVKARRAGYRVVYLPQAVAYHDEKHSESGRETWRYLWRYHRSRYLFAQRNMLTDDQRDRFIRAERRWLRENVPSKPYRAVLWACKLTHWQLMIKEPWLLRV